MGGVRPRDSMAPPLRPFAIALHIAGFSATIRHTGGICDSAGSHRALGRNGATRHSKRGAGRAASGTGGGGAERGGNSRVQGSCLKPKAAQMVMYKVPCCSLYPVWFFPHITRVSSNPLPGVRPHDHHDPTTPGLQARPHDPHTTPPHDPPPNQAHLSTPSTPGRYGQTRARRRTLWESLGTESRSARQLRVATP